MVPLFTVDIIISSHHAAPAKPPRRHVRKPAPPPPTSNHQNSPSLPEAPASSQLEATQPEATGGTEPEGTEPEPAAAGAIEPGATGDIQQPAIQQPATPSGYKLRVSDKREPKSITVVSYIQTSLDSPYYSDRMHGSQMSLCSAFCCTWLLAWLCECRPI